MIMLWNGIHRISEMYNSYYVSQHKNTSKNITAVLPVPLQCRNLLLVARLDREYSALTGDSSIDSFIRAWPVFEAFSIGDSIRFDSFSLSL